MNTRIQCWFHTAIVVALCAAIMAMAACVGNDAANNTDEMKFVMGAECVLDENFVVSLEKDGAVEFCGSFYDGWSCSYGKCELRKNDAEYGRVMSALTVGDSQVNPLTKSRGPCVPLTLVACCDTVDGCILPDGSPFIGRWICAPDYIDEYGWVHTSAESMPCVSGQQCEETGIFPNVGLCSDIPLCLVDADCGAADPCVDKKCVTGKCQITQRTGLVCDDGLKCTTTDKCVVTSPTDTTLVCKGDATVCDDSKECTTDSCDPADGVCKYIPMPDGFTCIDGVKCTLADHCVAGICVGTPKSCDDSKECTTDSCDEVTGDCLNVAVADSMACDDANACTLQDACVAGICVGTPKSCDDSNQCTADSCNSATGVCGHVNVADGTECDDEADPTGDACVAGMCIPGGDWCEEGEANECCLKKLTPTQHQVGVCTCTLATASTFGTWVIGISCGFYEQGKSCQNNAQGVPTCSAPCVPVCTGKECGSDGCGGSCGTCPAGELCNPNGACVVGCVADADCADANECTVDTCVAGKCSHTAKPEGELCDGGGKTCQAGQCLPCVPVCTGKECGSDGCGGSCGTCPVNETCNGSSQCEPPQCDATHPCPQGQFCGGGFCYQVVDLKGQTGTGQSGANGGMPDGTPDNWDNDGDCYCESLPCLGTVAPAGTCTTLFGGDCDDTSTGFSNHPGAFDWVTDNFDNDCNGSRACGTAANCNTGEACTAGFCGPVVP